jgi:hypothetical protein
MRRWIIAGLAVLLAGCGGEATTRGPVLITEGQQLISPTSDPATVVLPTITPMVLGDPAESLEDIDLAALLAHMPGQFEGHTSQLSPSSIQSRYAQLDIPLADSGLEYRFRKIPDSLGLADISLYNDLGKVSEAYARLIKTLETSVPDTSGQPVPDLGEQATQQIVEEDQRHSRRIFFVRCRALVEVSLLALSPVDTAIILEYAQTIDQRLQASSVCQ